ncbi:hypothetical protein ACVOMS_32410 [Bradyrhizobium guangxiense]
MAASILSFEARRDKQGRLTIYKLPAEDGGGAYEVAGINERFHPEEARMLADLIEAGHFQEAERAACEIIATYTDGVSSWSRTAGGRMLSARLLLQSRPAWCCANTAKSIGRSR